MPEFTASRNSYFKLEKWTAIERDSTETAVTSGSTEHGPSWCSLPDMATPCFARIWFEVGNTSEVP